MLPTVELVLPTYVCRKCDADFPDDRALKRHLRRRQGCIGMWYVCKRCLQFFNTPSEIKLHQDRKRRCKPAAICAPGIPREAVLKLRLQKGAEDAGSMRQYLQRVINRADNHELCDVLDVCTLDELDELLTLLLKYGDDPSQTATFIQLLAMLSNYSNGEQISPEKRAMMKHYVDTNVTL